MHNSHKAIERIAVLIIFLIMAFAGTYVPASEEPVSKTGFDLVIKDDLISLDAKDASVKQIVEEIGRRMDVKVDVHGAEDEKITQKFDRLPLEEALKRLSANYVYLFNSEKEKGKPARIVLLKKGTGGKGIVQSAMTTRESQKGILKEQEPFKFEFDPSQHLKGGK